MEIQFNLTPAEREIIRQQVIESLVSELIKISPDSLRKHAYTVKQVAEQISYSTETVLGFIHKGRKSPSGKLVYLRAKEITKGNYRVLPADLDKFLSHF